VLCNLSAGILLCETTRFGCVENSYVVRPPVPQEVEPWNMADTISCADPTARFPCTNPIQSTSPTDLLVLGHEDNLRNIIVILLGDHISLLPLLRGPLFALYILPTAVFYCGGDGGLWASDSDLTTHHQEDSIECSVNRIQIRALPRVPAADHDAGRVRGGGQGCGLG
jgi:hypothetical protein